MDDSRGGKRKTKRLPRTGMSSAQRRELRRALSEAKMQRAAGPEAGMALEDAVIPDGPMGLPPHLAAAEYETPGRPDEDFLDVVLQRSSSRGDLDPTKALLERPDPKRSASITMSTGEVRPLGCSEDEDEEEEDDDDEEEEEEEEKGQSVSVSRQDAGDLSSDYERARMQHSKPLKTRGSIATLASTLASLPKMASPAAPVAAKEPAPSAPAAATGGSQAAGAAAAVQEEEEEEEDEETDTDDDGDVQVVGGAAAVPTPSASPAPAPAARQEDKTAAAGVTVSSSVEDLAADEEASRKSGACCVVQ